MLQSKVEKSKGQSRRKKDFQGDLLPDSSALFYVSEQTV